MDIPNRKKLDTIKNMMFKPSWKAIGLASSEQQKNANRLFFVLSDKPELRQELEAEVGNHSIIHNLDNNAYQLAFEHAKIGGCVTVVARTSWLRGIDDELILNMFRFLKHLLPLADVRLELVVFQAIHTPATELVTYPVDGVFVGLMQTLANEYPSWKTRILVMPSVRPDNLISRLNSNLPERCVQPISFDEKYAYIPQMLPATLTESSSSGTNFRKHGHYIIIGGHGGLGKMLASYLAKNYSANLVILGRRDNPETCQQLIELGASSAKSFAVDLCDAARVKQVFDSQPEIDGVIHSALVLDDAALSTMDDSRFMRVIQPKVHGTINLLNAVKNRPLQFCLFFSSIQSFIANPGQANYSAACVAKDALAKVMQSSHLHNIKIINWAFWGNIGIVAKPHYRASMEKREIGSIEAEEGLAVIEQLLASSEEQITVIKASDNALRNLSIIPHSKNNDATNGLSMLAAKILPNYREDSEAVRFNEAMSANLQSYSRAEIARMVLPSQPIAKFTKLVAAIHSMKADKALPKEHLLAEFPQLKGHVELVDACIAALPKVLTGELDPLSILFPQGSFHLVEPVYRDNPIADYFNAIAAETVANFQAASTKPIRILEIGAGTGSTSQFVLPKLDPQNVSYTFTDLSFAFLNKARNRFGEYDFIDYKICNIESPDFAEASFDVIVATNVIHATSDLPKVMKNLRHLLAPGGVFVLNEITSLQDYATLTFGLTDGWWLSTDHYRIPNSPLVTSEKWQLLMREAGFDFTASHGGEDQQIILGMVASESSAIESQSQITVTEESTAQTDFLVAQHPVMSQEGEENTDGPSLNWVMNYITEVIMDVMHYEREDVDVDTPFSELGIDSLISLELLAPFKIDLGYMPATLFFEYSTVRNLANHLHEQYANELVTVWQQRQSSSAAPDIKDNASPLTESEPVQTQTESQTQAKSDSHFARTLVVKTLCDSLMMESEDIEDDTPFNEYGVDSLIAMEILSPLREVYGYLPATLFFEHPTVAQVVEYLAELSPSEPTSNATETVKETIKEAVKVTESTSLLDTPTQQGQSSYSVDSHLEDYDLDADIAIVGMSAKVPGSESLSDFWQQLQTGTDLTGPLPNERWDKHIYEKSYPLLERGSYTQHGAFMRDIDSFDHRYFKMTPAEAQRMDPQERLLLEQACLAMLDANLPRQAMAGSDTGVYVGVMNGDYAWYESDNTEAQPPTSLFWSMANRISYTFDLHGPSMAVDTACSSSLTALHLAAKALRTGECQQAIVGGVNVISHPRHFELLCGLHMLSPTEKCKPFGAGADGFVDGEGIVVMVMMPLRKAVEAGHHIHAVIKGSAINAGGKSNGYTAPNLDAQARVITKALNDSKVKPEQVSYVEAHGTGTELGDPIELAGLKKAYQSARKQSIAVGSLKSNIGHLESAAGLAGLLKTIMQLQHHLLVPSLNAQKTNPHLDFDNSPFRLNTKLMSWDSAEIRYAGVSSFGAGGANAHVILAEAPAKQNWVPSISGKVLIPVSHHHPAGLQLMLDQLANWVRETGPELSVLAYRLSLGREHHKHRVLLEVSSTEELLNALSSDLPDIVSLQSTVNHEVGLAYLRNEPVNWSGYWSNLLDDTTFKSLQKAACELSLPNYPFMPERHWVESKVSNLRKIDSLIEAHRINGENILPAAWSLSKLFELGLQQQHASEPVVFEDVVWHRKVVGTENINLQQQQNQCEFLVNGMTFCQASLSNRSSVEPPANHPVATWDGAGHRIEAEEIYNTFAKEGYEYGPYLQAIRRVDVGQSSVVAFLLANHDWGFDVSPALIDATLQLAMLVDQKTEGERVLLPYSLKKAVLYKSPLNCAVYAECKERSEVSSPMIRAFDFTLRDEKGDLILYLEKLVSVCVTSGESANTRKNSKGSQAFDTGASDESCVDVYEL